MGINQAAINIGGVVGGLTLPAVALSLGWQYGFLFVGLFGPAVCAGCAALYRDPPSPLDWEVEAATAEGPLLDSALHEACAGLAALGPGKRSLAHLCLVLFGLAAIG
jgi:hypothetical protein